MVEEPRDCYEILGLGAGYYPWDVFKVIIKAHKIVATVADTTVTAEAAVGRMGATAKGKVIAAGRWCFATISWLLRCASDSGRLGN
jgi:hypothetical protein